MTDPQAPLGLAQHPGSLAAENARKYLEAEFAAHLLAIQGRGCPAPPPIVAPMPPQLVPGASETIAAYSARARAFTPAQSDLAECDVDVGRTIEAVAEAQREAQKEWDWLADGVRRWWGTTLDGPWTAREGNRNFAQALDFGRQSQRARERVEQLMKLLAGKVPKIGNGPGGRVEEGWHWRSGSHIIRVTTGDSADHVTVAKAPNGIVITTNGVSRSIDTGVGTELTIETRGGDDIVEIGDDLPVRAVRVETGAGNDLFRGGSPTAAGARRDTAGCEAREYVNMGRGNDVAYGGGGDDVIYGGDGDDVLAGGDGDDYLDGGAGDDWLIGDRGKDVLSGGSGDDRLSGGGDADRLVTGAGTDTAWNDPDDTVYTQLDRDTIVGQGGVVDVALSEIPTNIKVEGSEEFRERVYADMQTFASLPPGQELLKGLGDTSRTITIVEDADSRAEPVGDYRFGAGTDATIYYNTAGEVRGYLEYGKVPSVVFFHEALHAYHMAVGTHSWGRISIPGSVDNDVYRAEFEVIGPPIHHSEQGRHPAKPTENDLRRALGLPERTGYIAPPRRPK